MSQPSPTAELRHAIEVARTAAAEVLETQEFKGLDGRKTTYDWNAGLTLWCLGWSIGDIAAELGSTPQAVKTARKRYDWPKRPKGRHQRLAWALERAYKGRDAA